MYFIYIYCIQRLLDQLASINSLQESSPFPKGFLPVFYILISHSFHLPLHLSLVTTFNSLHHSRLFPLLSTTFSLLLLVLLNHPMHVKLVSLFSSSQFFLLSYLHVLVLPFIHLFDFFPHFPFAFSLLFPTQVNFPFFLLFPSLHVTFIFSYLLWSSWLTLSTSENMGGLKVATQMLLQSCLQMKLSQIIDPARKTKYLLHAMAPQWKQIWRNQRIRESFGTPVLLVSFQIIESSQSVISNTFLMLHGGLEGQ